MRGAAVAIQRGNCTLLQKGIYAQASGAEEVIIVSNDTLVSTHFSHLMLWCKVKDNTHNLGVKEGAGNVLARRG